MKKYSIFITLAIVACTVQAQNRKHIAGFSQFQQYFNPALTGYQGTSVKGYYRDQFAGYDNAPKTFFASGEMNLADVLKTTSKHSFGLSLLHDSYGALTENRIDLSYSTGVQLTEKLRLKAGMGLTYSNLKIDNERLVMDQENDPSYTALVNDGNNSDRYALNIGVALTSDDYYVGYALNDVVKRDGSGNNNIALPYALQHVIQAGYRREINEYVGLIINGLYRYDKNQEGVAEAQLKAVLNNLFWIGAGYRYDLAYTLNAGVSVKQFRIGYAYEVNASKVSGFYKGGSEITLSYNFFPAAEGSRLSIW